MRRSVRCSGNVHSGTKGKTIVCFSRCHVAKYRTSYIVKVAYLEITIRYWLYDTILCTYDPHATQRSDSTSSSPYMHDPNLCKSHRLALYSFRGTFTGLQPCHLSVHQANNFPHASCNFSHTVLALFGSAGFPGTVRGFSNHITVEQEGFVDPRTLDKWRAA